MLKMKKMISIIVVACMLFGINTTVLAAETSSVEESKVKVVNLSDTISTQTIEEITSAVGAFLIYDDGRIAEIDSTVTIQDECAINSRSVNTYSQNSYIVTVNASISEQDDSPNTRKVDSDSSDLNLGVNASITLQLKWTDNLGVQNVIDEVSGTLYVENGTVTSGVVRYGDGIYSDLRWQVKNVGASRSFLFRPNMTVLDPSANYTVKFKESSVALAVNVSASILQ